MTDAKTNLTRRGFLKRASLCAMAAVAGRAGAGMCGRTGRPMRVVGQTGRPANGDMGRRARRRHITRVSIGLHIIFWIGLHQVAQACIYLQVCIGLQGLHVFLHRIA